jgi:glycosyltransferase involved in cell wall biosynthesis
MATYNGARFIGEQLDSLARQTHPPAELVVSDDASADETLDIVRRFAERAPFPVRIHRNGERIRWTENHHRAAALSSGDWIAYCDQDDVWRADKLERVSAAIRTNPDAVLVALRAAPPAAVAQGPGLLHHLPAVAHEGAAVRGAAAQPVRARTAAVRQMDRVGGERAGRYSCD